MLTLFLLPFAAYFSAAEVENSPAELTTSPSRAQIWREGIGKGFAQGARSFELQIFRAIGMTDTGSNHEHDLTVAQGRFGFILAEVMEPSYWFGGNLEGTVAFFTGMQDEPEGAYIFGANPGLRYHFRTRTSIIPYLGGSFGVAITDIGTPDATGKLQFNQQACAGARFFIDPSHAVSIEYAYWHISNGGIREPNDGVNAHIVSVGFAWLF